MMCKQNVLLTAVAVGSSVASFNNLLSVRNASTNHLKPTGHFTNRLMYHYTQCTRLFTVIIRKITTFLALKMNREAVVIERHCVSCAVRSEAVQQCL